jgi:hypothetical protein
MTKIEKFINDNLELFNSLGNSEVCEYKDLSEFDSDFIDYLKLNYRFDYKGICVYIVDSEIWVENMLT